MISLANFFFDEYALHRRIVKNHDNLLCLRENFIETFFKDIDKRNPSLLELTARLNAYPFSKFPILQAQYLYLFSLRPHLPSLVPEETQQSSALFQKINQHFGYFTSHERELRHLFHRLLHACRKLILLHEKTDVQDAYLYAYKIMIVFCDTDLSHTLRFSFITNQVLQFLSECTSNTPYHHAWVTMFNELPARETLADFPGWKTLFKQYRSASLSYFADAKNLEILNGGTAPKSLAIAQALLKKPKYKRAAEDMGFAEICRNTETSEATFEKGLQFIQRGWPRKKRDNLPKVRIWVNDRKYVWLKLPPQDKRALILGRYIPGCCQTISGAAGFCVEQGISLSSSGFYVLLKLKMGNADAAPIIANEINERSFEIVGQSYVWLSQDNNLCLDSIEFDASKVSNQIIKLVLESFAKGVYRILPDIKHIHIGSGGLTPINLFPEAMRTERIKEGKQYPDSIDQYCVANQMPQVVREQMCEGLSGYPMATQELLLCVIPYFPLIEQYRAPNELALLAKQIKPYKLNYIFVKKRLNWHDFSPITLDAYEQLSVEEKTRVSTMQKLMNAETDEIALAWMTTIPVQEYEDIFDFKRLKRSSYWFRFASASNVDLLIELVSQFEVATRHHFLETTALFSVENILSCLRDLKRFGIVIKLIELCIPEERFTLFRRYLHGCYLADFFVDQNIGYILQMVNMVPDAERVQLLNYFMRAGCLDKTMGYFFEMVSRQLNFEQFTTFMKFKLSYLKGKPVWQICYQSRELFEYMISRYTEVERKSFFEQIGIFNYLIHHEKYHDLVDLMSILSLSDQLEYIWDKKYVMYFIQGNMLDELQSLMRYFPQDIQVQLQDSYPIYLEICSMLTLLSSLCEDFKTSTQCKFDILWDEYRYHRMDASELLNHIIVLYQQRLNERRVQTLSAASWFDDEKYRVKRLQNREAYLHNQMSEQAVIPERHESPSPLVAESATGKPLPSAFRI
jgi:hypothetical protein